VPEYKAMLNDNFLAPDRHNCAHLRQIGYAFVDLIIDEVLSGTQFPFVKDDSPLPLAIPEMGKDWHSVLNEVRSQILPRCLNLHNPRYMGHMDSVAMAMTVWGDALISALNNNMLSHELAPLFTQLEVDLVQWFGALFGLGEHRGGLLTAGGSLANILALRLAHSRRGGDALIVPESAHTSFNKAVQLLGMPAETLIRVPCNYRGEMDLESLQTCLADLQQRGRQPFMLVAIAGTTVTGAFDQLMAIGKLAKVYDCWYHIDAAYGGAVVLSPHWKHLLKGAELADSITFNPQKWMWVARTCAMLLLGDRHNLETSFCTPLPYMDQQNHLNLGSYGIQGTRRADVLKLWLALQSLGTTGYAELIDRTMRHAQAMRAWVQDHAELELALDPTVNILCMRSGNKSLRQELMAQGKMWLSQPLWKGDRLLRAVLLHPYAQWQ